MQSLTTHTSFTRKIRAAWQQWRWVALALVCTWVGYAGWHGGVGQPLRQLATRTTQGWSAPKPAPPLQGEAAITQLKQQGQYEALTRAIETMRYRVQPTTRAGVYTALNPAHGFRAEFAPAGVQLADADGAAWRLGLRLRSVGYGTRQTMVSPGTPHADGQRLELRRTISGQSAIVEWYENRPAGLEQGFTLSAAPGKREPGEPLQLRLQLDEGWQTAIKTNGQAATLSSRKGDVRLCYDHLVVTDAAGRQLSAQMTAAGDELRLEVEDAEAEYPVTIDPTFSQQAYLKASNTGGGDAFGTSIAISGDTVVIGAPSEDSNATGVNGDQTDNSLENTGAAYVFVRNGSTWSQQAYLKASNTGAFDGFGRTVAISGDTIVVGASGEDSNATSVNGDQTDNSLISPGAAYVFVRSGTTWSQQAYLKASNTGEDDRFGVSVAISGDTIVVGANQEDSNATGINGDGSNNTAPNSGAAYVFVRSGTMWSQQAYLKASNPGAFDNFGVSVAISDNTVVIGANFEASSATGVNGDQSNNSASGAGAAYVFTRNGTMWSQQAYLKASNTEPDDRFGLSVAISGDTIVAGANIEDSSATGVDGTQDNGADASGAAYVFVRSGSTWSQQAYLKASNTETGDRFGAAVGVSGTTVVVGATSEDSIATGVNGDQSDNTASTAGAAYVFFAPAPEIEVSGNDITIPSGDVTPIPADNTDFGSTVVNGSGVTKTFAIKNLGTDKLTLTGTPKVSLSGSPDFSVITQPTSPVAVNDFTTFQITFIPTSPSLKTATVSIANDDSDENPYTFMIQGTGIVPNTAPSITPLAQGIVPGETKNNVKIATVTDAEDAPGSLMVSLTSANPANGITLSNLTNQGGEIFATLTAAANATNASFSLQVTDSGTQMDTQTLPVSVIPLTAKIGDPAICLDPGGLVGVEATLTNPNAAPQVSSLTATLPPGLTPVAGSCVASVNPGGCAIVGNQIQWNGTLNVGQTVSVIYRAQIAPNTAVGAQFCIDNQGNVGGVPVNLQYCFNVVCPGASPRVSAQKTGSVLVFPYYTSALGGGSDTRLTISHTGGGTALNYVHLFMIDGATCQASDFYLCLTPNASFSFRTSDYDPGVTGYVLAVAVNAQGIPIRNNAFLGNAFVNTPEFADTYGAEAFAANSEAVALVANDTAQLFFDSIGYDGIPNQFAVEVQSPLDAPNQQLVLASLNGNLTTSQLSGAAQVGTGLVINGNETPTGSFINWLTGGCQVIAQVTATTPRVPSGMSKVIPKGQSGTILFNVGGAVGLVMTPRTTMWSGIRTLHKTRTAVRTITIPVFAPTC